MPARDQAIYDKAISLLKEKALTQKQIAGMLKLNPRTLQSWAKQNNLCSEEYLNRGKKMSETFKKKFPNKEA